MKKFFLLLFIAGQYTTVATAQDSTLTTIKSSASAITQAPVEYVVMQNGKLMVVKNGTIKLLDNDMVLPGGATIIVDGTIKSKDGSTTQLQEGDRIGMDGKILINKERNIPIDSTLQKH